MDEEKIIKIVQDYNSLQDKRIANINQANEILRLSKEAIFNYQRGNETDAGYALSKARDKIKSLNEITKMYPSLQAEGAYKACLEEYLEAELFGYFSKQGEIGLPKLPVNIEPAEYIDALCDFIGELARKAVDLAINKKHEDLRNMKEAIIDLYAALVKANPSGLVRSKLDEAKRHIRKIEDILLDVSLKQ